MAHSHKPSALKQQNKKFKSRHATKGELKREAKGRIPRQTPKGAAKASLVAAQTRLNRQNTAKQAQVKKRQELLAATKLFGGADGAPRIVAVVPLCPDVSAADAAKALVESFDGEVEGMPSLGVWKTRADRFKTNLQFVLLPYRQLYVALDACKAADYVVFALSPTIEVDAWGELAMRCLQAQGLPEAVPVMLGAEPTDSKSRAGIQKSLLSFMQYFSPSQSRVHDLNSRSNALNAARAVCEGRPSPVRWREGRSWLLAEELVWEAESEGSLSGSLRVTGVVRGAPLSADRLVHIPEFGDFQLEKIYSAPLPRTTKGSVLAEMDIESTLLQEPDAEDAESLTSRLDPDMMANEQTWPTDEEMNGGTNGPTGQALPDAKAGTIPKRVKMVPRGTSAYQAAWIVDDDEDEDDDGLDSDSDGDARMNDDDETMDAGTHRADDEEEEDLVELTEDLGSEARPNKLDAHEDLDMEEEDRQHAEWMKERANDKDRSKEDDEDLEFPDEVDTPKGIPARERFARYRGLRSFRTSPWDPFENLPIDYARIFQFENYERTKRNVRRRAMEEGVAPGTRVTVYVKGVPKDCHDSYNSSAPFVIFGLWEYEHKITALHFAVQRNTEYQGSVRSKDPLIMCVGSRRFRTQPTYSQHTRGGGKGSNNVHKYEKYLRHGRTSVATVYGPTCFGRVPCMFLRENEEDGQAPFLVSSGTFLDPDTKRINAKRIILTGHPYEVHRRVATIRFMFFNPTDINYFKPIELHTKYGRTGHIQESLGTHGYFKAHFDKPLSQVDTVCLNLYKRVYPKWSTLYVTPKVDAEREAKPKKMQMS